MTINQQSILSIVRQFFSMTECFNLRLVNHTWKFNLNDYIHRELRTISSINEFNILRNEFRIYPINLHLESIDFNCLQCFNNKPHPNFEETNHLTLHSFNDLFHTIPSLGPNPKKNKVFEFAQKLSTGSRISHSLLGTLMNYFPNLTELNLKGFKNLEIEKVENCPFHFPKITSLILNGCLKDSIIISGIANIFYRFNSLTHLDLSNCNLKNVSTYLFSSLYCLHFDSDKLLSLNLSRTQLEDLKLIHRPVIRFLNLTSLDISYCSKISEEEILTLLPKLTQLTELTACATSITEETIIFIANEMPKIQKMDKHHLQLLHNYRKTLAYEPKSPLGLFYKIILNNNPAVVKDVIEATFQQLNHKIKVQLLHTSNPEEDLRGKTNIDPAFLFKCKKLKKLVQEVILVRYNMFIETDQEISFKAQFERKSQNSLTPKSDQLHLFIHEYAGSPETPNRIEWGRKNAHANLCLLADALEEADKLKYSVL